MEETITESYVRLLVSKNLKRIRSLHNISQLDLALKAGLAPNFINDIENGKKWTSAKTIAKLCEALNIEPFQFFLTEEMINDKVHLYIKDVNNYVQWVLKEVTNQYK